MITDADYRSYRSALIPKFNKPLLVELGERYSRATTQNSTTKTIEKKERKKERKESERRGMK